MPRLRLACYNVAWFERLFDRADRLVDDGRSSAMPGVTRRRQAEAVAAVLGAVDADCFAIIEAPNSGRRQSCVAALEGFARRFGLRQRAALIGFANPTHQEIALLYDPARIAAAHAPVGAQLGAESVLVGGPGASAPRFDGLFAADLDGDGAAEVYRFSKPPLEALVEDRDTGLRFRLIAVHLKSKAPSVDGPPEERRRRGIASRAQQFAQATWLRARIEGHLTAGEEVVALGDFNDGPGLDTQEPAGGRSSVALVRGSRERPATMMATAYLDPPPAAGERRAATARFPDNGGRHIDALIDFIMLSPGLAARTRPVWRIWNPHAGRGGGLAGALRQALVDASDHFPVSVDLRADRATGAP